MAATAAACCSALDRGRLDVINRVGLESVPARGRAGGEPAQLGAGGARGAGDRGPQLRGREPAPRQGFDLYADTRSQQYGGYDAETPATDAAVEATTGEVVTYGGQGRS
jgi:hypothetical protein